ncbi:transglycosylase SLT domain-containing protein [Streptomyces sp. NPDC060194]|uniref:transglycosylase SLT domain-containing protein n=1 Tax=Streptomyces sp. NPDC060194 TaxID=3347069 RepID=UPI0036608B87
MTKHVARGRVTKAHKFSLAGVATLGAAALALTVVPGNDSTEAQAAPASSASLQSVAYTGTAGSMSKAVAEQKGHADSRAKADAAKKAAEAKRKAEQKKAAERKAAERKRAEEQRRAAEAKKAAEAKAAAEREAQEQAASRSAERRAAPAPATAEPAAAPAAKSYGDNLDGWINEALDIMSANGIPGSYDGIHRNIMRESGGNPNAINNYDINAQNGTPSIGLLQVIQPTFEAYHVAGTANDVRDPVANIVAACNYAADNYGSIDNVDSAY